MAASLAQVNSGQVNAASLSIIFNSPTTAGSNIHVFICYNTTGTISTVGDNNGNTYNPDIAEFNSSLSPDYKFMRAYTATNISGRASHQITISFSSSQFQLAWVAEVSGEIAVSPFDVSASATGAGTGLVTAGPVSTTAAGIVFGIFQGGNNSGWTVGSGFVIPTGGTINGEILEFLVLTSPGSQSATATITGSGWGAQIITYKSAVAQAQPDEDYWNVSLVQPAGTKVTLFS